MSYCSGTFLAFNQLLKKMFVSTLYFLNSSTKIAFFIKLLTILISHNLILKDDKSTQLMENLRTKYLMF